MELQLRQKYNINLVAIKRGENAANSDEINTVINVPMPNTIIYNDDILMVSGADIDLARLPQE